MRHWKESFSVIAIVLAVLVFSVQPAAGTTYYWDGVYGSWSTASNWTPNGVPSGSGDYAYLGDYITTTARCYLSADATIGYLKISNHSATGTSYLTTNYHTMLVNNATGTAMTYLTESAGYGDVMLQVARGTGFDDFDTDRMSINNGAELYMLGGIVEIDDYLYVDSASYIKGWGIIKFASNNSTALRLNGTLQTTNLTESLTLQVTGTGKLDLDGTSGASVINVTSGTSSLIVDGQLYDAFDGTINIGEGNSVNFTQAWTHSGTLNFNAGSGTATLSGAAVTVNQAINANSGTGHIMADVVFDPGTAVAVANGATLRLYGDTTYQGSSYTGAGTLAQYGDATIATNTTIGTSTFDWDGGGTSETTVNSGVTFTINSDQIDIGSTDGFDGTVNVNGGTLTVNTTAPWRMEGTMNLNYDSGYAYLYGSEMILTSTGTLNAGNCNVYAPITVEGAANATYGRFHGTTVFESTANVSVSGFLSLLGPTTFKGGSYTGAGRINQLDNVVVEADTTIDVDTYDWDGNYTTTINPGVSFIINSTTIDHDAGENDFGGVLNINGGRLYVNTTDPWAMRGTMNLNYTGSIPKVYGTEMIVRDSVGLGEGINVTGGEAYIYSPVTFESDAKVNVASGAKLHLSGATIYQGGSYTGAGTLLQDGNATIEANTTIDTTTFDWDGGGNSETTINSGVTFTIDSSLIEQVVGYGFDGTANVNGGTLTVNTTDPWRMDGTMNLNSTVGTPRVYGTGMIVRNSVGLGEGINATGGISVIHCPVTFESDAKVNVASGAELWLDGMTIFKGGSYTGDGTIRQNANATVEADTTIDVTYFDLDGYYINSETTVNSGVTFTINSDSIENPLGNNNFDSTVNIDGGTLTVNTTTPWAMQGTMNLDSTSGTARVYGTEMIVRDSTVGEGINATGGVSYICCPVTFETTARVHVDTGAMLALYNTTTYQGGAYTGGGKIYQYGDANVEADTTIDTSIYDWDGGGSSETTVNSGATFTINSTINDWDWHNGIVTVNNNGHLVVNSPWTMAGTINLTGNGNVLDGSRMTLASSGTMNCTNFPLVHAPVTVEGTIAISPSVVFFGDTIFESTAVVNLASGEYINLSGPTTYRGGTFTGDGKIRQNANAVIHNSTSIDLAIFDWDGGSENSVTTINPGVTFTLNVDEIEHTPGDGYDGTVNINSGATLAVNTPGDWTLEGQMNLAGGQVIGREIINEGTIGGYGTIAADDLDNNGTLSADGGGGTLVVNTAVFPNLDGTSEAGVLEAMAGNMHVMGSYGGQFGFNSQLYVGSGREFRMDNHGLHLWNSGLMNLQGGTYVAPEFTNGSSGTLTINTAPATLRTDAAFYSGSTTTLNAALHIDGSLTVYPGATVTGSGRLIIDSGSTLDGNGSVGVDVANYGHFKPGTSAGTFTIGGDYAQPSSGTLTIEIGGLTPGSQHDQVVIAGGATLAGGLRLPLIGGYEPDYYDEFEIFTAGAVSGVFDWIKGVDAFPKKYLAVVYNADNVTVVAAIPGDANLEGNVDDSDLSLLLSSFGTGTGGTWGDGDFNGDGAVDDSDLSILLTYFGATSASLDVPEPATILLLGFGGLTLLRRRRK